MNDLVREAVQSEIQSIVNYYIFNYGVSVVLVILVVIILVGVAIKITFEKKIAGEVEKNVNKHKAEIEISHAKKIGNYHHYIAKRHEVYSEFNSLLLETEGLVTFQPMKSYPNFSNYTIDELEGYMKRRDAAKSEILEMKELWESNPREIQKFMQDYTNTHTLQKARRYWIKLNNYYWANALYFSDKVKRKYLTIKKMLSESLIIQENPTNGANLFSREDMVELRKLAKNVSPAIDRIIKQMKKELSAGFSE